MARNNGPKRQRSFHNMFKPCRLIFLLASALTLLESTAVANNKQAEAAALVEHAKQLSDIRADGAHPFRLRLDFRIIKDDGRVMEGVYTEVWVSKSQWRRETALEDFRRIQIAAGRKSWIFDSSPVAPEHITDIPLLFDTGRLRSEVWKLQRDREVEGTGAHCVENRSSTSTATWALCFDKVTGALIAESRPPLFGAGSGERVCLYSDYQKFGDQTFARSYNCTEGKRPSLTARIVELAAETPQDPTLFTPPEGAKESANCLSRTKPPAAVHTVEVIPPQKFDHSVVVVMSVVVGTDGLPRDLEVTSTPDRYFAEAALKAVRQWKFKPATCDGEPVETKIAVETEFHHY
jgi:TonB family protein